MQPQDITPQVPTEEDPFRQALLTVLRRRAVAGPPPAVRPPWKELAVSAAYSLAERRR